MKFNDSYNYSEIVFRNKDTIKLPGDVENKFITEEMILSPLYKKIKIDKNMSAYEFFPMGDVRIECYCKECNRRRIYSFADSNIAINSVLRDTTLSIHRGMRNSLEHDLESIDFFTLCAEADCNHKMILLFKKVDSETIMKVGQCPSIYDLNENINNKSFLKDLGKEYADYYKKACSLYSFSSYIGALTYLRRIFEKTLIDTFNEHVNDMETGLDDFMRKRMDEKVKLLRLYLPKIMFEQGFNVIYSKISDGIHNLTEEECNNMFMILKMAIEEILIERIEKEQKNKRIQELSKELQEV